MLFFVILDSQFLEIPKTSTSNACHFFQVCCPSVEIPRAVWKNYPLRRVPWELTLYWRVVWGPPQEFPRANPWLQNLRFSLENPLGAFTLPRSTVSTPLTLSFGNSFFTLPEYFPQSLSNCPLHTSHSTMHTLNLPMHITHCTMHTAHCPQCAFSLTW